MTNITPIKLFKLSKEIKLINTKLRYLSYIILLQQYFIIMFFLVMKIQPQISLSFQNIAHLLHQIQLNYFTIQNARLLLILMNILNIVLIIFTFLKIKITSNYDQVFKNKKIQNVLLFFIIFIGYFSEITIVLLVWSFSQVYLNNGLLITLCICFLPIMSYTYFSYKHKMISMYGIYTVPVVFIVIFIQTPIAYLLVIFLTGYLMMVKKLFIKKLFYGQIILLTVFIIKNKVYEQGIGRQSFSISCIYFGLLGVLLGIMIYFGRQRLNIKESKQSIINNSMQLIDCVKGQLVSAQMKKRQYIKLYKSIICLVSQNSYMRQVSIQRILNKKVTQITKKQYYIIFEKILQSQCSTGSKDNINKLILLLRIRLVMNIKSMNEIVDELFKLCDYIQRQKGNRWIYQYYELFELIINRYGIYKNNQLQISYMIRIDRLKQCLQYNITKIINKLQLFWSRFISPSINITQIDNIFNQIINKNQLIQSYYNQLSSIYQQLSQSNLLSNYQSIISSINIIINPYYINSSKSIHPSYHNQLHHNSFLIIENNIITYISNSLTQLLAIKHLENQSITKQLFFGSDIVNIIDSLIQNINYQSQLQSITIPILISNSCIQIFNIKIIWYPSLQVKNKFLIQFYQLQTQNDCFILYHSRNDTIKYFNSNFVNHFQIDLNKFRHQISNQNIFFNELFIDTQVLTQQIKNYLTQNKPIKCKLYLKNYIKKGSIPSIPVEIYLYKSLQINQQTTYWILKIDKIQQKKISSIIEQSISNKNDNNIKFNKQIILNKNYQNQKFFCKIPNPYQNKIIQTQSQLQETRWSYRYFIHILFGFIICSLLVFWILNCNFLQLRIKDYQKIIISIQNVSQQYAILYQAYSVLTKRYMAVKDPINGLIVKQVPMFIYDSILKDYQQSFLDDFLKRYLAQLNNQPNHEIEYKIDFKYFSIQSSTQQSTLVDYIQHFENHINDGQNDFLLKNYNNFRELTIKYQNSFSSQDQIKIIIGDDEIYYWILIGLIIAIMILVLIVIIRIQNTLQLVYKLVGKISLVKYRQNYDRFNKQKQKMLNILNINNEKVNKRQKQQQKQKQRQQKSNIIIRMKTNKQIQNNQQLQMNEIKNNQFKQQLSIKSQINQLSQQYIINNSIQLSSLKQQLYHKQRINNTQKINNIQRITHQSIFIKLYRHSFFIIALIVFSIISYIDYNNFIYQQNGIAQLFDIKKQIYIALLHGKRLQVDGPILPILQDYFNISIIDTYHTQSIDLVSSITDNIILEEMKNFKLIYQQAFNQNLCNYIGNFTFILLKPCQSYLDGVITKGFRQTFDIFFQNSKILSAQNIYQFFQYQCTIQQCTPYLQNEVASILIGELLRSLVVKFNQQTQEVFGQMIKNVKTVTLYKTVGIVIFIVLYICYSIKLRNRCKIGIGYLKIIPRQLMHDIKVTLFMKNNDFLNKVTIL